jgi:hypothetical protein
MVSIYMRILKQGHEEEVRDGQVTEVRTMIVSIPTQTGFDMSTSDASPVALGDELLYGGRWYSVRDIEPDIYGAVYKLTLKESKKLSAGVGNAR